MHPSSLTCVFMTLFILVQPQITFRESGRIATPGGGSRAIDQGEVRVNIIFDDAPLPNASPCQTPDERPGFCKSLAECAIFFAEIPSLLEKPCTTKQGQEGVCCPTKSSQVKSPRPGVSSNGVLSSPPPPRVVIPNVSEQELLIVVDNSIRSFTIRQRNVNKILFEDHIRVPQGSPTASHHRLFTSTNDILNEGEKAQLNIEASIGLVHDLKLSKLQGTFALPHISARDTPIANTCPVLSECTPDYPYRTIDGSCNNLEHPDWGKAGTAFQRILSPKYGDGVSTPRTQGSSGSLPSPRRVSASFAPDVNRPYNKITLMLMQWGQFLAHDITHTPIVKGENQTSISCCQDGQLLQPKFQHPDCFPIIIPRNDPFFSQFGQQCMDYVRSLPAPRRGCNFGPREQMSQITSYIDGSNVYGSNNARASVLREGLGGRLQAQVSRTRRELLPASPNECSDAEQRRFCFNAGDFRVNEQLNLVVMHTVWLREHNRIANALEILNPNWSDEILYQETRRIVIAEMQHITYNEFLPLILGPEYMRTFNLAPVQKGYTNLYNSEVDPTITNAFATAAYRFGHSLVQGIIQTVNQFGTVSETLSLSRTQFQPFPVYDDVDSFVRGLATQESQRFDNFVSDSLTKHLFQGPSAFGLDLVSLNIQRGRDHGLPPYNDWREVCGLPRIDFWEDLNDIMKPQTVANLQQIYNSVDDIDLFVGGLGERPLQDAVVGPVFVCLVGDQFARLRRGDRFFYDETTARFTEAQLDQIRKISLARIICDNSDEITVIQPLVMQKASVLNRRLPCSRDVIPALDLTLWREFRPNQNPDFGHNADFQRPTPSNFDRPEQTNFGSQSGSNFDRPEATNFGSQSASNFDRPEATNFGSQSGSNFDISSTSNFDRQETTNFRNPSRSNFEVSSTSIFVPPSISNFRPTTDNGFVQQSPFNFATEQSASDFSQTSSNVGFNSFSNQFQQPSQNNRGRQSFGFGK